MNRSRNKLDIRHMLRLRLVLGRVGGLKRVRKRAMLWVRKRAMLWVA